MNSSLNNCKKILKAFKVGELGQTKMPEDSNPGEFKSEEARLAYFTLPMALNYQRDSYKLWEAVLKTYIDSETRAVFDLNLVALMDTDTLKKYLLKHKVALQPNKHPETWQRITKTIVENWGSFEGLLEASDNDFLKLKQIIQQDYKKGFPYLSGPKIFNYWSFILQEYGKVELKNAEHIEIAPDTHIIQSSVKLGVITKEESEKLSRDEISTRWREVLKGSGINPIEMHPPLWFWSRNGFKIDL